MKISIGTVFPELYTNFFKTSLVQKAFQKNIFDHELIAFSSFCLPKEHIDAPAVGHGNGMVIRPDVVQHFVESQEKKYGQAYKIFVTPQGQKLNQDLVKELADVFLSNKHIMFVAGRYEGIDVRVHQEYADKEISIGDYILMGGDLPVMVILESVLRLIPDVVQKKSSVIEDSFTGAFVDHATYASPAQYIWKNRSVPSVLSSGNHKLLEEFRLQEAAQRSVVAHFDWVRSHVFYQKDRLLAQKYIPSHYVVLMHDEVLVQKDVVGRSSITSLDIHDIARSCATYGIKKYFLVSSLSDQKKIAETILHFWHNAGIEYNHNRAEAVHLVQLKNSFDDVYDVIAEQEGVPPLIIATSARYYQEAGFPCVIDYTDQELIWKQKRPVLFVLGTAKGLSDECIKRSDYLLMPLSGFKEFNHLSVRSAAAIILDRWMGLKCIKKD